jgi:hypothetical protein
MKTHNLFFIAAILLTTTFISCDKDDDNPPQTFYGTAVKLGNDSIRSFITLDVNGQPTSIGLRLDENALNGLPTDTLPGKPEFEYAVPLPAQASASGIDHIEVDWNPFGHEPQEIYGVPHFDMHFYYVSETEQASVIPGPDTTPVAPQFVPKDYAPDVVAVPNMGVHWIDTTSSEFHGVPFTSTFIYGFYHGNFMFVEPMITKAFLESHPNFSASIKQPQVFQKGGFYANNYEVKYDAVKQQYVIALNNLIKRYY